MKIILDNDATVVDYRRFIDKFAIPYFNKRYHMDVAYEDELELEDIFDCKFVVCTCLFRLECNAILRCMIMKRCPRRY